MDIANGLDCQDKRLDKIEATLSIVQTQVAVHSETISTMEEALNKIDVKLDKISDKIDEHTAALITADATKKASEKTKTFFLTIFGILAASGIIEFILNRWVH